MKIKMSLLLAVLIYISVPTQGAVYQGIGSDSIISGSAFEDNNISGAALEENSIINIIQSRLVDESLLFFAEKEKIDVSELCDTAYVVSDTYKHYYCDIKWDSADDTDTSSPGRITLRGKIIPPDGFEFNGNDSIECTVIIYDDDNPTEELADFEYDTETTVVHLGENLSEYLDESISLYTTAGDLFTAQIRWQDTVAPNIQGEFQAEGIIILPKGIRVKNKEDIVVHRNFYAMKDDKIYLKTYFTKGGNIVFPWLYRVEDTENVEIQYSLDNENWSISKDDEFGTVNSNQFLIFAMLLDPDTDYYFRLYYNGEYTDTVLINPNVDPVIIGGDHDGGDNYEQTLPPVIQETPVSDDESPDKALSHRGSGSQTDSSNKGSSSGSAQVLERSDANTTIISGKRLMDLAEINDNKIIFEKEGISAELSEDFIERNDIKEDDIVSVTISKNQNDDFSIDISINNNEIKEIPDTVISLPKAENTYDTASITDKHGTDANAKKITIDETGSYKPGNNGGAVKLSENISVDETKNSDTNISVIFISFAVMIMTGLVYILRRSYGKYAERKK